MPHSVLQMGDFGGGPVWLRTHEIGGKTTKHQTLFTMAKPQHFFFRRFLCPLLPALSVSHVRLKTHTVPIIHALPIFLSPSPFFYFSCTVWPWILGSMSANYFRRMPSSRKKREKKG
ncbi:hypothetical protein ILYODFUR_009199 [Ilyodon furcidens]|uniref:Uncharacterized protein n=1 Tax=Ilyodon furcidens TaxID=33524 RepID=A0ABV0TT79_9TELE